MNNEKRTHLHPFYQNQQYKSLQVKGVEKLIPPPQLLYLWIRTPSPKRDLIPLLSYIDEAGVLHPPLHLPRNVKCPPNFISRLNKRRCPVEQDVSWANAAIIRLEMHVHLDVLEPAAGLCGAESFGIECGPVGYTAREPADMYKVEGVRGLRPLELRVVHNKEDVRGDPFRLDGGDICGSNLGRGELVGKVPRERLVTLHWVCGEEGGSHCPDACSSTDIDYSLSDC